MMRAQRLVLGALAVAFACPLLAATSIEAETVQEFQSHVTRLQQTQPNLRQSLNGLQGAIAKWPERISALEARWRRLEAPPKAGRAVDPEALIQTVLRESYLETTEDLRFYAEKVRYFNAVKKSVRDYIQQLREVQTRVKTSCGTGPSSLRLSSVDQAMAQLDSGTPALQQVENRLAQRAARFDNALRRDRAKPPATNVREAVVALLRDSIKEMNEDKKYYLQEIEEANKAAALLADHLKELADASAELAAMEAGKEAGKTEQCGAGGERPKRP